jgi:replicative DNA helicase
VIISKQRHGPIGTIKMTFEGKITKFGNYIGNDHLPDER